MSTGESKAEPQNGAAEPSSRLTETGEAISASGEHPAPTPPVAAAEPPSPSTQPAHEMGFSDSTQHWLADGELPTSPRLTALETSASYDGRAVSGRRRTVAVVGGAAVVALLVAGTLYAQAWRHRVDARATAVNRVDPARDLTRRAEEAYRSGQLDQAFDLAHLALAADSNSADAHFVLANCHRARNELYPARDEYRKYLELAPIGIHAAAARASLATLPP